MDSLLQIGGKVDEASAEQLRNSVLAILASAAGDEVKCKALEVMGKQFEVTNTVVSNCSFVNTEQCQSEEEAEQKAEDLREKMDAIKA